MSKEKKIFFIYLSAATVILCIVMFFLGRGLSIRRTAMNRLNAEIKDKQEEYNSLSEQKTQLETEISTLTDEANSNSEINVKIKSDEEKLAELNSQLDTAKKTNEALTKQLEEKKSLNSHVNSVSGSVSGKETKLAANTYSCPDNIEAGTYEISAKEGNIIVYGTNGKIRVSKNLASIDGNSYTLTIKDGERIKFDKEVTIKGEGKVKSKSTNDTKATAKPN